jgi:hypothetical protein
MLPSGSGVQTRPEKRVDEPAESVLFAGTFQALPRRIKMRHFSAWIRLFCTISTNRHLSIGLPTLALNSTNKPEIRERVDRTMASGKPSVPISSACSSWCPDKKRSANLD